MHGTKQPGPVAAGWSLLWQTQRILWWIYAVNLVLGFFSAVGFEARLSGVLDHSLAAQRLYHGFDIGYFLELAANPDVQLATRPTSALCFGAIFLVFMLFANGGVLEAYARSRMLVPGEFFQGCGAFFWRFVRLLLWLVAALAPIALLASAIRSFSANLSSNSPHEMLGFWVEVIGLGAVVVLLMAVRLWFDMAQVRTVVEDEHGMTRTLGCAFKLTCSNFGTLFWIYARLSLLAWAGTAAALIVWTKSVPAERIGVGFLLAQFIAWLWITTRLWQRASEVIWYQRQRPIPAPVEIAVPESAEMASTLPVVEASELSAIRALEESAPPPEEITSTSGPSKRSE